MSPRPSPALLLPPTLSGERVALRPTLWRSTVRGSTIVALATLLGLVLRLAAARGDLGLDEIWSLKLVASVQGLGGVLWGLSHDNNHLLNSAWLYVLGPDRPIWAYRLPAVALGTLTVPTAARWLGRRSPAAGAIGAILAAVALPLVDFGSEARGYAGLALATVLALDESERAADAALAPDGNPVDSQAAAWRLGLAAGFGALCHLAMAFTLAVIGLTLLVRIAQHTRRGWPTVRLTARLLGPAALLVLPAVTFLVAGIVHTGRWTIGDVDPFTLAKLADGFGGMLLFMSGLPDMVPGIAGIAATVGLGVLAMRRGLLAPKTRALAGAAFVALPLAVAMARLPNVGYPRYFAVCGLVLLAVQAEILGTLWNRTPLWRPRVAGIVLALVANGFVLDAAQIRDGRGGFGATLALMRADGAPTYTADRPFMAALLLDAAALQARDRALPVTEAAFCRTPPDWFIAVGLYDSRPGATIEAGPAACRATYAKPVPFGASPLSGTQWTLYRRS